MRTIILEGIATSGKSTILGLLEASLANNHKVKVVPETETIMAVLENTSKETSLVYLKSLIEKVYKDSPDVVIFDRLYLTHIFRVHGKIEDFSEIESLLRPYSPVTIFLRVDENLIAERVKRASEHRMPEWKEYIFTKGKTFTEIADYYIGQQRNQIKLLADSSIPYNVYDTSSHSYEEVTAQILKEIDSNNLAI